MKKYKSYTTKQFMFLTREFLIPNKLGMLKDITDEYLKDSFTWERVFSISTKNKAVDVIIFSSLDMRQEKTREKDSDCVRLVLRWKTKNGFYYAKLAKHYRLATLFDNMKKSIQLANENVFNLKFEKFHKEINKINF